ncbi:TIGR03943 family putative permease subunit [Protaetiibacter larvae]|uniref:TIGR03943 family protein n=1 Tax=Protaetiibacter larvae TaxID=2592654 RepID=A0A5C1Y4V6_9MICO|nr:TIGR03943 family protein [Protaetiibacter larvae]QEO08924.1 TIGR03943 family protein [Protaetiibacter larvae]
MLSLVGIVAIAGLALTGRLGLYIHPRYFVFTVIMAGIAAVVVLAAFALLPTAASDDDGYDGHEHGPTRAAGWQVAASAVLIALTAVALLVLPPATLTSSTVEQRDLNGSTASTNVQLVGGDDSALTVKDWAGLLRQGVGDDYLAGKTPTLVGFVTPDADDPDNVFYVTRFVITCCAVDAQPVGVPVYLPGWQGEYATDSWVSVTGAFIDNPSTSSMQPIVLSPAEVVATDQPEQPYVY